MAKTPSTVTHWHQGEITRVDRFGVAYIRVAGRDAAFTFDKIHDYRGEQPKELGLTVGSVWLVGVTSEYVISAAHSIKGLKCCRIYTAENTMYGTLHHILDSNGVTIATCNKLAHAEAFAGLAAAQEQIEALDLIKHHHMLLELDQNAPGLQVRKAGSAITVPVKDDYSDLGDAIRSLAALGAKGE